MTRAVATEGAVTDTRRYLDQWSNLAGERLSEIEEFDFALRDTDTPRRSIGGREILESFPEIYWLENTRKYNTSLHDSDICLSINESMFHGVQIPENDFGRIFSTARIAQFVTDKKSKFDRNREWLYYITESNEILDSPRMPSEDTELDIDNAKLRVEYLQETLLLTETEVAVASGTRQQNKRESVSVWKREGKLFAVRHSGIELYPAFQFEDGAPLPIVERILTVLPKDMSGWQVAMWFASGNGWLGGDEPQERLLDPEAVIVAAQRLADPAIG